MLGPDAPDVSIEAVGFHYCKSWVHKLEMATMMETDTSEILNEIIFCTRKVSWSPVNQEPVTGMLHDLYAQHTQGLQSGLAAMLIPAYGQIDRVAGLALWELMLASPTTLTLVPLWRRG